MQDEETRQLYFGVAGNTYVIDALMERVIANPDDHKFLVAKIDNKWIGTIHLATYNNVVEFGVIVSEEHRGNGVAGEMLEEAILWARNRGFHSLYMHCLSYNSAIKHLCIKHGLSVKTECGESDVKVPLPAPTPLTFGQEIANTTRNMYTLLLQRNLQVFESLYG